MLWALKISAKVVLTRVNLGYSLWQRLGLFRHGAMDDGAYAISVFRKHHERLQRAGVQPGFVGLELGPGDSASSALLARCFGASRTYLVDAGPFARRDMGVYKRLAETCDREGLSIPSDLDLSSLDAFLASCRAEYLTEGLASLRAIPSGSIDAIWSQAVLEHIRVHEFSETLRELRRALRQSGAASHRVDLRDHLTGALNNLRFSESVWESRLMSSSGFYTNRIRYRPMIEMFESAGFETSVISADRWSDLPTARRSMVEPYRSMPKDDLIVSGFDVLLTPR